MDLLDNAQIEIERELDRNIASCKKAEVQPTTECIECGADIPVERQRAIKTNLCIGCAEFAEVKARQYR